MKPITIIGLDLAKRIFQVHGAEANGGPVVSQKLCRAEVLVFFKKLSPCLVGRVSFCGVVELAHETRTVRRAA